jgi:diaminopimelate decarboxylase
VVPQDAGGRRIAVIHAGSDLFVRTCYCPAQFPLRVELFDAAFAPKRGEECEHDVAGPLCFGGDKVARQVTLPRAEEGDVLAVMDAGANCLALWSRHCSRPCPPVLGYRAQGDIVVLKPAERLDAVLQFWG